MPKLYSVNVSARAKRQLQDIIDHIREQGSAAAAEHHGERLLQAVELLERSPLIGRPGPRGTRELTTVSPHVIRYRVIGTRVTVIRIRHAARRPTE